MILFRLYEDVDVEDVLGLLRGLSGAPGLLEHRVELSLDERKGKIVVQESIFSSPEALARFRMSARHQKVAQVLSSSADWWVADYFV